LFVIEPLRESGYAPFLDSKVTDFASNASGLFNFIPYLFSAFEKFSSDFYNL
jgi:hypothetical protein